MISRCCVSALVGMPFWTCFRLGAVAGAVAAASGCTLPAFVLEPLPVLVLECLRLCLRSCWRLFSCLCLRCACAAAAAAALCAAAFAAAALLQIGFPVP